MGLDWISLLPKHDGKVPTPEPEQPGLYVGLVHTLSWSILPHGGCCFLHLGHISHVQIIIQYQETGLALEEKERLVGCAAGGWPFSQ